MKLTINEVQIENLTIHDGCKNSSNQSSVSPLTIKENSKILKKIKEKLSAPEELDALTKDLGIPSILVNYHLSSKANLSHLNIKGVKNAVHIPATISSRDGGRESTYKLKAGQTTLVGMFVTNNGILLRYMKRETGDSEFSEVGDTYKYTLKDPSGKLFYEGRGKLIEFNKKKGEGKIRLVQTDTDQVSKRVGIQLEVSIGWSFIRVTIGIEIGT